MRTESDHALIAWVCLPTLGIVSAGKKDFIVTFVANWLAQHRRNGLVLVVHANRAGQVAGGSGVEKQEKTGFQNQPDFPKVQVQA